MTLARIELQNTKSISEKFKLLEKKGNDLRPLFGEMITAFYKVQKNIVFRNGRASGPGRYADLKKVTQDKKSKEFGFIYPVLVASGRLMNSFKKGGSENITKITKLRAEAGSRVPYARYVHEIVTGKQTQIP